ncbi:MAG: hypothetical protein LC799_03505, partial [Actinobacteria bacterium]|nr:hypothetical protein [Actinomycetota bacterium]
VIIWGMVTVPNSGGVSEAADHAPSLACPAIIAVWRTLPLHHVITPLPVPTGSAPSWPVSDAPQRDHVVPEHHVDLRKDFARHPEPDGDAGHV